MTTTISRNRFPVRHVRIASVLAGLWATMGLWRERAEQRRHLAEMSPEMLRDIGISASAARAEAGKPFWVV